MKAFSVELNLCVPTKLFDTFELPVILTNILMCLPKSCKEKNDHTFSSRSLTFSVNPLMPGGNKKVTPGIKGLKLYYSWQYTI